jgi:hypothetical protein
MAFFIKVINKNVIHKLGNIVDICELWQCLVEDTNILPHVAPEDGAACFSNSGMHLQYYYGVINQKMIT